MVATTTDGSVTVEAKKTTTEVDSREALTRTLIEGANAAVNSPENDFGVVVVDVGIKAADFPEAVEQSVFSQMRTEREVQADRLRAEGEQASISIRADVDRQIAIIVAEAVGVALRLRGDCEGEAFRILADALELDPEFFAFRRSLEAYQKFLNEDLTTLVLPADSELFRYLQGGAALGESTEGR